MPHPENLLGYSFIIKGKVGRRPSCSLSSVASHFHHQFLPQTEKRSLFVPLYMGRPELSQDFGKIFSGTSTTRVFHFEKSSSHK